VQGLKDNIHEENKKNKDPQEAAAAEEGGSYYNLGCYPGRFLRCEHSLQPWVQRPA
jgi:hypothetical protein